MKAIITVGVSASGKTFWAKTQSGFAVVSRDDVRREILCNRHKRELLPGELWKLWKWKDESVVSEMIEARLLMWSGLGKDIIVADTNLNPGHRAALITKLRGLDYEVEVKDFPVTFEEACRRDAGRADGVGMNVIWRQYQQWNEYIGTKKYVRDRNLPRAVLFDVDGTLATMGPRGPFEWEKVDLDFMREEIVDMFRGFKAAGYKMVVMSGRDSVCYQRTADWLADKEVFYDEMFMRAANDMRADNIVKEELFWNHVAHKYDVALVVDDRPKVARHWRLMGLNVAQVADPLVEF